MNVTDIMRSKFATIKQMRRFWRLRICSWRPINAVCR